eukprot:scaffold18_cov111-Isochrysis_galbana.AAC.5
MRQGFGALAGRRAHIVQLARLWLRATLPATGHRWAHVVCELERSSIVRARTPPLIVLLSPCLGAGGAGPRLGSSCLGRARLRDAHRPRPQRAVAHSTHPLTATHHAVRGARPESAAPHHNSRLRGAGPNPSSCCGSVAPALPTEFSGDDRKSIPPKPDASHLARPVRVVGRAMRSWAESLSEESPASSVG